MAWTQPVEPPEVVAARAVSNVMAEQRREEHRLALLDRAEREAKERARLKARYRVSERKPAAQVRAEVDDLLTSEVGPSVLALVEIRDNPKTRPVDRLRAVSLLLERALGPVQTGPQVQVNVDSSLMALARRLGPEGLSAVRERAGLPPGPPSG